MSGKARLRAGAWGNLEVMSQRQKSTNNFIFKGTVYKIYDKMMQKLQNLSIIFMNVFNCDAIQ